MDKIKIKTLKCGSIHLHPKDTYMNDKSIGSSRIELPVNVFYIEHPIHGKILIDTGLSDDVTKILPAHLSLFYRPNIRQEETAAAQLHQLGVEPEDIDVLVLTHLDADHTCALKDFAGKAKRIVCPELEYFYSSRMVYKRRQVWDTWIPYADMIERIHFRASVLGPVGRGFDLFDDDSFLFISCPGHTSGIVSTIISQGPSNRFKCHGDGKYGENYVVLASDVAFTQRNIDDLVSPGYCFNRELNRKGLEFLSSLQQDPKCLKILYSHDPKSSGFEIEY